MGNGNGCRINFQRACDISCLVDVDAALRHLFVFYRYLRNARKTIYISSIIVSMQKFSACISKHLNVPRLGSRMLIRDDDTLIILDMEIVSDASLRVIQREYPNTNFSFHSCSESSSGYILIFELEPVNRFITSRYFFMSGFILCYAFYTFVLKNTDDFL